MLQRSGKIGERLKKRLEKRGMVQFWQRFNFFWLHAPVIPIIITSVRETPDNAGLKNVEIIDNMGMMLGVEPVKINRRGESNSL